MKKLSLILVIVLSFILMPNAIKALECNEGLCYCDNEGLNCEILNSPSSDKNVLSSEDKCGCIDSATAESNITFCEDTSAIWQFIGYFVLMIKIVVPLAIIIIGIIDLAKAITSNDDKALSSASLSILKRVAVGVAIFFVPTLASLLFSLVKDAAPFLEHAEECQTCLLRPTSDECNTYKATAKEKRDNRNNISRSIP